ncbi:MAG: hypothetical protein JWO59_1611 [Chloroflexi bacterium]|nr:hypothetical protein [Chloroflexota bacterium]
MSKDEQPEPTGTRPWLDFLPVQKLHGAEDLPGTGKQVIDFWRWALSDLRMNTIRPILAEYLVALAMRDPAPFRVEWAPHDVRSAEGITIEVKSSGYCQSWRQRKLSAISFGRLSGLPLSDDGAEFLGSEREIRANIFVFAVQICKDPLSYNALDLSQWEFRVLQASVLRAHGARSIGYATVLRHAPVAVTWQDLRATVLDAARGVPESAQ